MPKGKKSCASKGKAKMKGWGVKPKSKTKKG